MRIAIIAALPGELKQIVNTGWKKSRVRNRTVSKWLCAGADDEWIAVCAGMGAEAALRALVEAEADGKVDLILSVGWAGALNEDVNAEKSYIASAVIDAQTGERFELSNGERNLVLVSTARVALEPEKRRLAQTYSAAMVDMESATVLRLAQMRGIPVCCIKAISDEVGQLLPDFNSFIDSRGQMRMVPFLLHIATRPRYWKSLVRLGRVSNVASQNLASAVFTFLTGPKNVEEINRTGNVDW